ncbi:TilS domain-containing protein [Edwardsiella anguillarum]|uniref:hypothetical protein n=1 Tax=Edwardsiella anguillarum TaxID=1821960 RepID=UPI0005EF19F4|nr:hypothetical protein QY76_10125 [Edwardsiella sp. EA181011]RFT01774.1 hypothetical protein CGL57_15215 [Edwardsiella anguillarum]BET84485.1 TilS domain-containing protein [Edwardsiella anguillarum]BET87851.1 TilS domain-containing protein [Edwardsiella anguillarum]
MLRLRRESLHKRMAAWLVDTGLNMEKRTVPVTALPVKRRHPRTDPMAGAHGAPLRRLMLTFMP